MTISGRLWPAVLGAWLAVSAILMVVTLPDIAAFRVLDPDDWMRLLEVRDWLGGQSWWDVAQHRLNGGDFPMHWSRLVDLPLAAVIAPLDPTLGPALADRVAMTVVPLVTLLAIMAGAAALTFRLTGRATALMSVPLVPLAVPVLMQARPMRIDHHGWQIALALWAVAGLASRPRVLSGALTGLALATLITISLEGLPITVAIVGIAALAWAMQPTERAGFTRALGATLFGAAALLHLLTRGPHALAPACDAVSPAYLLAASIGSAGLVLATFLRRTLPVRLAALLLAAGVAAVSFALVAPGCLRGPFATLDPLVYRYWYLNVLEGMPVWQQGLAWAMIQTALPIAGLIGGWLGWRGAQGEARSSWTPVIAAQIAAFALAVLVSRAGGTANALAIPGAAVLFRALMIRARAIERPLPRVVATVGAVFAASPGMIVGLFLPLFPQSAAANPTDVHGRHVPTCDSFAQVRAIGALPPSIVFAPIDLTPEILVNTPHRAIAAGYHRGAGAMRKVIAGFMADPARARAIVGGTGARYLVACAGSNETDIYKGAAPDGLWARLERGERVDWLTPVRLAGSPVLVWRVNPSAASPPPAPTARRASS